MLAADVEHSTDNESPIDYPRGQKGDRQALVQLQRTMHKLSLDESVPAHIRAKCAGTWKDLQLCKRIMDGKPLPGQLRPDLQQVKQHKRKGPSILPLPEVPAPAPPSHSAVAGESSSVSGKA